MRRQLIVLLSLIIVTGCHNSHSNRLLKVKKGLAVRFLYQAQNYASQKTRTYDATGSAYIACVVNPSRFDNPITGERNRCNDFFEAMVDYSKQCRIFNGITANDLKDRAVIKRLRKSIETYQASEGQSILGDRPC